MNETNETINGWDQQRWDEIYMPKRAKSRRMHRRVRVAISLVGIVVAAGIILFAWKSVSASAASALRSDLSTPIAANSSEDSPLNIFVATIVTSTPTPTPTPVPTPTPAVSEKICVVCEPHGIPFLPNARYLTLTCRFQDPKRPRHVGIDVSVEEKTEIVATMDGLVTHAAYDDIYGNKVVLTNDHYETWYAHNIYLLVREGDYIHAGEVIALSGNTGLSDGPHLHYEVRVDGIPKNPLLYLGEEAVRIATDKCIVSGGGGEPCP